MKIAIVCPYDIERAGGVQVHILDLANSLRKRGHNVWVIAPKTNNAESCLEGIALFGKSTSFVFNETQIDASLVWGKEKKRLKQWLADQQFDVIHFHTIWDPFLSFQILSMCKNTARVATFHDTPPETLSGNLTRKVFYRLSQLLYRWLDGVSAVSVSPAAHLYKSPTHPIRLMPPSINYSSFLKVKRNLDPSGPQTIFFVSRLDPRKGVLTLLKAYEKIKTQVGNIRLVIAGDGEDKKALEKTIKGRNIQDVHVLGYINEDEKIDWLAKSDVFCSPAHYGESFGIVLVEAMATGVPVIAAANSGYKTILHEKVEHCLFTPTDEDQLAERLLTLLGDEKLRTELSVWGREQAIKYDIESWVGKWEDVYKEAIKRRGKIVSKNK